MNNFGENIFNYRKRLGWSQEEFADEITKDINTANSYNRYNKNKKEICYSGKAVSKWERGESFPPLDVVVVLAKRLGLSLDQLFNKEIEECRGIIASDAKNVYSYGEKVKIAQAIDNIQYLVINEEERTLEYQTIRRGIVTICCMIDELEVDEKLKFGDFYIKEYKSKLEAEKRAKELGLYHESQKLDVEHYKTKVLAENVDQTPQSEKNDGVISRWVDGLNSYISKAQMPRRQNIDVGAEIVFHKRQIKKEQARKIFQEYYEKFLLPHEKMKTEIEIKPILGNQLCLEVQITQRFLLNKEAIAQIRGEIAEEVERERVVWNLQCLQACTEYDAQLDMDQKRDKQYFNEMEREALQAYEYDYRGNEEDFPGKPTWAEEMAFMEEPDYDEF